MGISIFPVHSKPFGCTFEEWSTRWWQWLLSIPKSRSPAFDLTGANARVNQDNAQVFFLCQTYEEGAPLIPHRNVTVPTGTAIFMPIINWISILHHDGESEQELVEIAAKRMDVVANLQFTVNDFPVKKRLEEYRVRSDCFDIMLPKDNILSSPPGAIRAVSDGYWLFFKLSDGNTKISSFGSCSSGVTNIGVCYNLATETF